MNNPNTKTNPLVPRPIKSALLVLLLGLAAGPAARQTVRADDGAAVTKMRWDLIHFSATPVVTADAGGQASAKANDDSMITLTGSGTFLVRQGAGLPNGVTGGGTWETFDPKGNSTGSGTYTVTQLLSWQETTGCLCNVPGAVDNIGNINDTHAGLVTLRIQYSDGSNGTLLVSCDLPGAPENIFEGVTPTKGAVAYWNRLAPTGADNRTVFHALPGSTDGDDQDGNGQAGKAKGHRAFGQGTSLLEPGVLTAFQFDATEVLCSVGHAVMPKGTVLQMFMVSEHVDSFVIDPDSKTVTITGSMVSFSKLEFTDGTSARLWETVPFKALATDGGTLGKDSFSLTVTFTDTPALDQFDLFGSPATFAGTMVSGDVTVR